MSRVQYNLVQGRLRVGSLDLIETNKKGCGHEFAMYHTFFIFGRSLVELVLEGRDQDCARSMGMGLLLDGCTIDGNRVLATAVVGCVVGLS